MRFVQLHRFLCAVIVGLVALGGDRLAGRALAQCGPTTLQIEMDSCIELGQESVATIRMVDADNLIIGGQFFLSYNPAVFQILSVDHGDAPFTFELFENTAAVGQVDYAVTVFPLNDPGTSANSVLATITFQVIGLGGEPFVRFRLHDPPTPSQLITNQGGLAPLLMSSSSGQFDLLDFADFQRCYSGDGEAARDECRCQFDFTEDNDVDEIDYRFIEDGFGGPSSPGC